MSRLIRAILAEEHEGAARAQLREIDAATLPDEDVLIAVSHSTVNYKDGLAVTGKGRICRRLPMICGIDLAGSVVESRHPDWQPGDRVLVNGYGLSETHWGGYSELARMRGDWLVRVPEAFSNEQAMAIGTAGYTAMLCVHALQDSGLPADRGPILVTGAAGGVGSVAVLLLARLGYEVVAATGRPETVSYLTALGAARAIDRAELARPSKPMEKELWAGAVDSVGSTTLATVLAQLRYDGVAAACGLAGGADLPGSVLPFILRGVTLRGIDSVMAPMARRVRAWADLARLIDRDRLRAVYTVAPLAQVPELAAQVLAGTVRGRVVIDLAR